MERLTFNPEKLKDARIARGLTIKELAEKSNISRQMISNYELGKTVPKGSTLINIINVLDFPYEFFNEESEKYYQGAVFFRSKSAATKKVRDMQSVRLKFQKTIYKKLSNYVNFPKLILPDKIHKDINEITNDDIECKARELRILWGLGEKLPIVNLIKNAEVNGIVVVESNMSDKTLDAVSSWIEDRPFIMLTDNEESAVRRRFNVAHELGHIILHNGVESIFDYSAKETKLLESQANYFASCLLLPEESFLDSLISTNLDYYIALKRKWQVSIQAMIMRTYQLDIISEDQKLYLFKKIASKKWKTVEPLDDVIPLEFPFLFNEVYNLITKSGIISGEELLLELKLSNDEIEKSLNLKTDEKTKLKRKPFLRIID